MKEKLPSLMRIIMVLGAITLISFLFPNTAVFPYKYHIGQSWPYSDLYAPFDFAVNKSEDEIAETRLRIKENFYPYYQREDLTQARAEAFHASFDQYLSNAAKSNDPVQYPDLGSPGRYRQFGEQVLISLLQQGIVRIENEHKNREPQFLIYLIEGNVVKPLTLQSLNTHEEALAALDARLLESGFQQKKVLREILVPLLAPNIFFDRQTTASRLQSDLDKIVSTKGLVEKGDLIILRNGIVTDSIYQVLSSYEQHYQNAISGKKRFWAVFSGYFLLTLIILGVFVLYLRSTAKRVFDSFRKMLFTLMWIVIFSYLVFIVSNTENLSIFLIPFCIVPIVFKNFFSQRVAFLTHLIIVLIAAFLANTGMHFIFLNLIAGIVALLTLKDTREWGPFFKTLLLIFLSYIAGWIGLRLITQGTLTESDLQPLVWFFINVFLTLLAYPIIPLFGRIFGFISAISLSELSDFNRPLLKKLSLEAPGTFQHSLQVANLAEAAAERIDAHSLLVKVGALYHDIGKLTSPKFFVENQSGNNPHEGLKDNFESAKKIIAHIPDGVKKAEKARLPVEIIQLIKTHHGTTRVEFFYRQQLKEDPEARFDEALFRYPGPKPSTKEQCILMLADSIEATAKSLRDPTDKDLDQLVDNIIKSKLDEQQFEQAAISFQELEVCRNVFKNSLRSIYHPRIEYPDSPDAGIGAESGGTGGSDEENPNA